MVRLKEQPQVELINVHQVRGDKDAIVYLKNADHDFVEGLFYTAKRYGRSNFEFRDLQYDMIKNKDSSFTIQLAEEQEVTTEQFA